MIHKIYEESPIKLDQDSLLLRETIFHNANGYIGIRGCFEEDYPETIQSVRGSYINGFYDFTKMEQAEKLCGLIEEKQTILNIVDTQTIRLSVEGEDFSLFEGTVEASSNSLDMENGVTKRHVIWKSKSGKKIEITIKRMTSFVRLPIFLIEYSVKALNFEGEVRFESIHSGEVENYYNPDDPRVAGESKQYLSPKRMEVKDEKTFLESETITSKLCVATAVGHCLSKEHRVDIEAKGHSFVANYTSNIKCGEEIILHKYTAVSDSIRHYDCKEDALQQLEEAMRIKVEQLFAEQREYLDDYWKRAKLEIEGDEELNLAVRYNMYQLLQSVGKDPYSNIAAKGLSGEGYEGHYFWDTEMYMEPYFLLTSPEIVKSLISYRYATLNYARENARSLGHEKGALYPWRTIMGKECSGYFPSGSAAYHINGDIAYSIIAYYLATNDLSFIEEKGLELLVETSRLWMDVGNWSKGKFHINVVTGPDEYTCMVNNNYYTNALAKYNLYWTVKFSTLINNKYVEEGEIEEFQKACEGMNLPYDEELKINPQDDSFLDKKEWNLADIPKEKFPLLLNFHPLHLYRYQICKQADTVMSHFILEDMQSLEVIRNSYLYYEKITTHDSSLSTAIFSIMASKLGMEEKAYQYFGDSAKLDLFNTHKNTKDGIHTANMAGNYMAIIYGFAGLRIKEEGLFLEPSLPEKWESYVFHILYQNRRLKINVNKSGCIVTLEEGDPIKLFLYGVNYQLKESISVNANYDAIIFDLDGVICHTDHYHYLAWKAIADKLGVSFDETINNRLRGVSRGESFEIILEHYKGQLSEQEKEKYLEEKNEIYKKLLEKMSEKDLQDEVKSTLESFRNKGIKMAIGSSSKNAKLILTKLGVSQYFDAISDGNCIEFSKPHPEVFLKAAEYLGVKAEKCLVVEDAFSGIEAANSAGMSSAAIADAAKSAKSTYCIQSIADLVKMVR